MSDQSASETPAPAVAEKVGETASEVASTASATAERPEVQIGAAFAGGFLTAMILKRLGG